MVWRRGAHGGWGGWWDVSRYWIFSLPKLSINSFVVESSWGCSRHFQQMLQVGILVPQTSSHSSNVQKKPGIIRWGIARDMTVTLQIHPKSWLLINGRSVHIPSFSKTCSPWTVRTFGVIPEQGKKLNQNSLFHSSMAKRTYISILVDLRAAQNVFWLLPYLFSHGLNGHLSFWICVCYALF